MKPKHNKKLTNIVQSADDNMNAAKLIIAKM